MMVLRHVEVGEPLARFSPECTVGRDFDDPREVGGK